MAGFPLLLPGRAEPMEVRKAVHIKELVFAAELLEPSTALLVAARILGESILTAAYIFL